MIMQIAALLSLVCATGACACTIPVFRYALDRWEADKFHLVLPASAAQDAALQDVLRPLRANGKANMDIKTSRDPAVTMAELRNSRESSQLVWSGALDQASLAALLDSPARKKIVESILAGDSFIWVIADNGSPQDVVEVERIEKRLRFLEQVAALPIQDPNDPDSQLGPGPLLRLKFSTLRLRRGEPAEKVLLKMLAGPKGEFDPENTSFAAPVFGKGRVLGAWPLALLDDATLEEASMFLVGRCGCRIKNENPGWDLLLNVDWEKALLLAGQVRGATKESNQSAVFVPKAPEVVAIIPEAATQDTGDQGTSLWVALGAVIFTMLVLWGLKSRRV
jgi:LPXTG-motif cell wall-anchored protein